MLGILENNERTELIPVVADFTEGRPDKLKVVLPPYHVIRIPTDTVPEEYAYQVVRYCELSAWVEDPALIIKLLWRFKYLPLFNTAIERIKSGSPPKFYMDNRVWDTCLLALDLPFMNREDTRQAIEYFLYPLVPTTKPAGVRVLVVKGPEKSGKSFTFDYIRYINSIFANLNFRIIWVDFKKQITSRFGPMDLVESLIEQVNPNWEAEMKLPELESQQPSRWMIELVRMLVDQINNANRINNSTAQWFIILDGFDDQKVTRETIEMIQVIASVATGAELANESFDVVRLVLLGFQEAILNYRGRVRIDNIVPLEKKDVERYFTRYANFRGKVIDAAALNALVESVQMNSYDNDPFRTRQIARKALQIAINVL